MLAALGAELGVVAQRQQRVLVGDGLEDHVAALAAHAAVGAAPRDVGLAAEAHAAASAVAPLDEDLDPIDEHGAPPRAAGGRAAQLGGGQDAHAQAARAVVFEADDAVRQREERVVLGQAHVLARLPLRAVLAEDDRAAADLLAAEALDAQPLRVAVAPVAARALTLLVRHGSPTSQKHWSGVRLPEPLGRPTMAPYPQTSIESIRRAVKDCRWPRVRR